MLSAWAAAVAVSICIFVTIMSQNPQLGYHEPNALVEGDWSHLTGT